VVFNSINQKNNVFFIDNFNLMWIEFRNGRLRRRHLVSMECVVVYTLFPKFRISGLGIPVQVNIVLVGLLP